MSSSSSDKEEPTPGPSGLQSSREPRVRFPSADEDEPLSKRFKVMKSSKRKKEKKRKHKKKDSYDKVVSPKKTNKLKGKAIPKRKKKSRASELPGSDADHDSSSSSSLSSDSSSGGEDQVEASGRDGKRAGSGILESRGGTKSGSKGKERVGRREEGGGSAGSLPDAVSDQIVPGPSRSSGRGGGGQYYSRRLKVRKIFKSLLF